MSRRSLGLRRIEGLSARGRCCWLLALAAAGFGWLWIAQQAAPNGHDLAKSGWVLYYPKSSGYFTEARRHHEAFPQFLGNYEQTVAAGDVLHQGTHPPGLIIAFELLLRVVENSPTLRTALAASEPEVVRTSFRELQLLSTRGDRGALAGEPLSVVDRGTLWLAFLLVHAAAALAVFPIYGLLRRSVSPAAAWLAVAFWPTVPALALFIPKSDALFPLLSCLVLYLWLGAVDRRGIAAAFWGLLAGLVFWGGLMLSLAPLVVGFWAVVATIQTRYQANAPATGWNGFRADMIRLLPAVAGLSLGIVVPTIWFSRATACDLLAVWLGNYHNHAGFYLQYPRTWWKWMLVNPLELTVAAGLPLACVAFAVVIRQVRDRSYSTVVVSFGVTWGVLLLSGKNMGEAARLWLFLIPGLCWIAGEWFETDSPETTTRQLSPALRCGLVLLASNWRSVPRSSCGSRDLTIRQGERPRSAKQESFEILHGAENATLHRNRMGS
ncbi:MAG: hypothetical protein NT069_29480 [Planctomycetota bacterium]|nr:hypothetical protein [Planctomycetota bacterium]